jgi:hypothetical protein
MKRLVSILSVYLLVLATTPVMAGTSGAHFFSATSSVSSTTGALVVDFDEAGLGNIAGEVAYNLHVSSATAVYACINGGGNHPKAANKEAVSGQLDASGSFPPTNNGRVIASLTVGPVPNTSLSCPSGQTFVLASVSYSGITLTDTTNGVSVSVSNVSKTFINI